MRAAQAGLLAGLALFASALSACATAPAPIARGGGWGGPSAPDPYYSGDPRVETPAAPLQCVPFARAASGIEIYGDANTWWMQAEGRYPRSHTPAPGSVLVMRGYQTDARGHVAVVTQILSSRQILVDQANWMNGGEVARGVPVMDVSPDNDWSEVRVWWIPTRSWGARVYEAFGFIHPLPLSFASS